MKAKIYHSSLNFILKCIDGLAFLILKGNGLNQEEFAHSQILERSEEIK